MELPFWGTYYAMNWSHVATMVPLHATLFAVAVACTCLTRHAAIGGVLTFVLVTVATFVTQAIPALDPIDTYNRSQFVDSFSGSMTEGPGIGVSYSPGTVLPPAMVVLEADPRPLWDRIRSVFQLLPPTYPLVAGAMGLITILSLGIGLWSLKRYRPVVAVP